MATTLEQLLDDYVYVVLQDTDNKVRWTRDELTRYYNFAVRDLISRRPEAGVLTDANFRLVVGVRQTLPASVARLKQIVCNETRVIPTPTMSAAVVSGGGSTITLTFSTGVQA